MFVIVTSKVMITRDPPKMMITIAPSKRLSGTYDHVVNAYLKSDDAWARQWGEKCQS